MYKSSISLYPKLFVDGDDDGVVGNEYDDDDDGVVGDELSPSCCTGKVTTSYLSTTTTLSNTHTHPCHCTVVQI